MTELQAPIFKYIGAALFLLGNTFVLSSMWALGITGTYLGINSYGNLISGDYFGILMDEMVTSFPFNVLANPMYVGSAMSFFGTSFWYGKPIGFLLSVEVSFMYVLAMLLEGPFTTKIYAMRDEYFRRKAAGEFDKKDE
jgi:methylene-fatty-acyl-phospholipid synthase